jgi:hypothetical protein
MAVAIASVTSRWGAVDLPIGFPLVLLRLWLKLKLDKAFARWWAWAGSSIGLGEYIAAIAYEHQAVLQIYSNLPRL